MTSSPLSRNEATPGPIPNADLIRAVLDGKVVQFRPKDGSKDWQEFDNPRAAINSMTTSWESSYEHRLKPEPVVRWMVVVKNDSDIDKVTICGDFIDRGNAVNAAKRCTGLVKLQRTEYDPDTLEVISAKTEIA